MPPSPVLRTINQELLDYKSKQIQIVPGFYFNQFSLIEKIFFYYNSKFQTGEVDDDGDKKYFFNIVKNPCKVFSKAIDFDTKNIRLLTAGGGSPLKTWFMERDLKYWMRDKQFGKVLNRIFHDLPIFGTVVLKVVNGEPHFVDLRFLLVEQSADTLGDSSYITEMHNYTVAGFRKVAKEMKWEQGKIDKVIEEYRKMKGVSHIRLYERYGDVGDVKEDGSTTWEYKRVYMADVGIDEYDQWGNLVSVHPGVELSSEKWEPDNLPYWEFHAEKMPGRWLGIGVVETLIEPQIRMNEVANVQAKTTYWAGLRIFQTQDPAVNRNLYTDTRNGEIMNVESNITQIDMSDRNLPFFTQETDKWLRNRAELTFSYDVVQGERLPAGTPLGAAQIAQGQSMSYFEQIQENVAMDVKELIFEVVIPNFEKENTAEHTIRLVGEDLDAYVEMCKNDLVMKEIIRQVAAGRPFPTSHEKDIISIGVESAIKQGKEKILTVPKDFYKDVKYDVDIDITGESIDTRVRYATRMAILQAITADPTMLQDPTKKKFLSGMAEDGGINPVELFGVTERKIEDVAQVPPPQGSTGGGVGGGVSSPMQGVSMAGAKNV